MVTENEDETEIFEEFFNELSYEEACELEDHFIVNDLNGMNEKVMPVLDESSEIMVEKDNILNESI